MDVQNRYLTLMEAVEEERKAEEKFYTSIGDQKTLQEKIEGGFVWYPIEIANIHYALGENIEIKIKQKNLTANGFQHKFKVGISIQMFNSQPGTNAIKGVISSLQKNALSILTNVEKDVIESFESGLTGIEIIYDEKPYQVMKKAIHQVMNSNNLTIQVLRKALEVKSIPDNLIPERELSILPSNNGGLNDSQNQAVLTATKSRFMSIIHGPPGTGKTTTLVELTKSLLKKEKRILVCAASNNAVDVLATRLHFAGLKVLRIGNITRIHDELADLTIIEKLRNHPEWSNIKKVKIQAEQIFSQASKFKRSFGPQEREERKRLKKEAYDLRNWARELENRLSDEILCNTEVVATTLISASHSLIEKLYFDTVIIDEASQALEPECWVAMLKAKRVILAGDHLQLPPTVKSQEAIKKGLEITILDIMAESLAESSLLNVQYRMNDVILGFPNQQFYQNKLSSFTNIKQRYLPNDEAPLVFIDTAGCGFEETINPKQISYKNEGEYFILREYLLHKAEILVGASIGILSPYAEQVRYITEEVSEDDSTHLFQLEINTIDGFQGQEKDVIIISLVRSNHRSEIGFLKDARRLNVAMTRARKKLIIIGDSATIAAHPMYNDLIVFIEKNGTLDSGWNYMSFS
ncbi:MAG: AAA domain-containing protein [Saprospiraceae bacterium]